MTDSQTKIPTEKATAFSERATPNRFAEPKQPQQTNHVVSAMYEAVTVHKLSCHKNM